MIRSTTSLDATRQKLKLLEENYRRAERDRTGSAHVREIELRSLKQLIKQLKEEVARMGSREPVNQSPHSP